MQNLFTSDFGYNFSSYPDCVKSLLNNINKRTKNQVDILCEKNNTVNNISDNIDKEIEDLISNIIVLYWNHKSFGKFSSAFAIKLT